MDFYYNAPSNLLVNTRRSLLKAYHLLSCSLLQAYHRLIHSFLQAYHHLSCSPHILVPLAVQVLPILQTFSHLLLFLMPFSSFFLEKRPSQFIYLYSMSPRRENTSVEEALREEKQKFPSVVFQFFSLSR